VNLFADAVEENIPDRLLRSQPITTQIIDSLSENFASTRFYDPQASRFVITSWADALGLFALEPSILTNANTCSDPKHHTDERSYTSERNWFYQDGTNTAEPVMESQMAILTKSGKIHNNTLIWSDGMTDWQMFSTVFPQVLINHLDQVNTLQTDGNLTTHSTEVLIPIGIQVRPWVRFFARWFDFMTFCLMCGILLSLFVPSILEISPYLLGILLSLAYVFAESIMLSKWGTTPAKKFLNISVLNFDGSPISYDNALKRSFNVWVKGLGLGLPLVGLFTQINSYNVLKKTNQTSWDSGMFVVSHKKIEAWKIIIVGLIVFVIILMSSQ